MFRMFAKILAIWGTKQYPCSARGNLKTLRGPHAIVLGEVSALAEGAGEAVGILQIRELDGHAQIVMAHNAAAHAAEDDHGFERRPYDACD